MTSSIASRFGSMFSKANSTLSTVFKNVTAMEQKLVNSTISFVTKNNPIGIIVNLTSSIGKGVTVIVKNTTTAVVQKAGNLTTALVVSGKNFSVCLNITQVKSLNSALMKNVSSCATNEINITKAIIQSNVKAVTNIISTGLNKTIQCITNMTSCMQTMGKISSLVNSTLKLPSQLMSNTMGCAVNLTQQLTKTLTTVGVTHMGCTYKLVTGKLASNATRK